jgi:hypothetical protein
LVEVLISRMKIELLNLFSWNHHKKGD